MLDVVVLELGRTTLDTLDVVVVLELATLEAVVLELAISGASVELEFAVKFVAFAPPVLFTSDCLCMLSFSTSVPLSAAVVDLVVEEVSDVVVEASKPHSL